MINTYQLTNQCIRSLDDVHTIIQNNDELRSFLNRKIILLRDDNQVLSKEHLKSAQEFGSLNITLSDPDTGSEMHKENLRNAFNIDYVDNGGMIEKFLVYLNGLEK